MECSLNWPSGINVWPVNGQRNGQLSNSSRGNYSHVKRENRGIKIVAGKLAINGRAGGGKWKKELIHRESVNFFLLLYCSCCWNCNV